MNEENADLIDYSDANFAVCKMTRRSTGEYIFMLNEGPISWSSKRQSTVALFTIEAEYYALSQAVKEATWLRKLFTDLGLHTATAKIPISIDSMKINADSTGAIKMAENPIESKRTTSKHFDIYYHFVQQEVSSGRIQLNYVPIAENIVDGLTKPLAKPAHQRFVEKLRLNPNTTSQAWYMDSYTNS